MLPFLIFSVPALLVGLVVGYCWARFRAWRESPVSDAEMECSNIDVEWDELEAQARDEMVRRVLGGWVRPYDWEQHNTMEEAA